jgi:two-component system cell cycle sensor histidine kinase/response regulator CckA
MLTEAAVAAAGIAMLPGHRTILVVEDESFVRDVTCEILESAGYRVLKTRNAAEALRTFRRYRDEVQLLLTDVVMPGQSGCSLAQDLKAISPTLRTIFISGYPENVITRKAHNESGVVYLPKPFSGESLLQKVSQVLEETFSPKERSRRAAGSG